MEEERIFEIVKKEARLLGLEICEIKFNRKAERLMVVIDKEGGVSVEDCADLNRKLLDAFQGPDYLNVNITVSSPGLNRPLKTLDEFRRKISFTVVIEKTDGTKKTGKILRVDDENVYIAAPLEEKIPVSQIVKARIVI